MKLDRCYLAAGLIAGLCGCQVVGPVGNRVQSQAPVVEAVAVSGVAARSQGVNLEEGMPVRTTAVRQSHSPYRVEKSGFAYRPVPLWPALRLASVGPLPTVDDPGLLPPPVRVSPVVAPSPPSQICATPAVAGALDAGPRQNWVMRKARSLTQLLWEGFARETPEQPTIAAGATVVDQGLFNGQRFRLPGTAVELVLSAQFSDRGLKVTSALVSDETQPVVHLLYLEQRDCQRAWPDRWQVALLWPAVVATGQPLRVFNPGAGGFIVQQAPHEKIEGNSDKARLAHYQRLLLAQAPAPVWQQLGFAEPEQGVQVLESYFSRVAPASFREDAVLVVHVANAQGRRYRTQALVYRVVVNDNGTVQFRPL